MELGDFKLAYVDPQNPDILMSDMFDSKEQALQHAKDKQISDYFLFKLNSNDGAHYSWTLLDHGQYRLYRVAYAAAKHWFIIILVLILLMYVLKRQE